MSHKKKRRPAKQMARTVRANGTHGQSCQTCGDPATKRIIIGEQKVLLCRECSFQVIDQVQKSGIMVVTQEPKPTPKPAATEGGKMFAVLACHGRDGHTEYITCGIQDTGVKSGGKLMVSKVYFSRDYADIEEMSDAIMAWVAEHKVKTMHYVNGLLPTDSHQSITVND